MLKESGDDSIHLVVDISAAKNKCTSLNVKASQGENTFLPIQFHPWLPGLNFPPKKVRTWSLPKTSKIANLLLTSVLLNQAPPPNYKATFHLIRPICARNPSLGSSWHHIYYSTSFVRRPSPNPTLRSTACATPSFRPTTRSEPKFENYCVRCHPLRTTENYCYCVRHGLATPSRDMVPASS